MGWAGGDTERGAEVAVADLNAKGGVLGEQIELITADDYCDGEQAVAAANKLVADRVVAVFGHQCSGAAIPASKIYADAGILMISTGATNPQLTEQGFTNVFRVVGRDDSRAGSPAICWPNAGAASPSPSSTTAKLTAKASPRRPGSGSTSAASPRRCSKRSSRARQTTGTSCRRCRLWASRSCTSAAFTHEAGLIIRQAREHGYALQLVAGDGIDSEDFGLIAGPPQMGRS